MTEEKHNTKNQVDELDIVKLQLLTSYLGLAKQKVDSIVDTESRCQAELELARYKKKEATAEVEKVTHELNSYYVEIRQKYGMAGDDKLNFATGEIQRVSGENDRLSESQED